MTLPTFDANTRSIAERKVKGTLGDHQQKFGYRLADLHSQFAKAGGIGGSAHQQVIRDACRAELRERFQVAWEILRSVAIDFGLPRSEPTAEELKTLMRELVVDSTSDLRQAIELTKRSAGAADGRADVAALIQQVLPEAEADVDLFVSATRIRRQVSAHGVTLAIDVRRVFMSHAAIDAPQATLLKEEIERRVPGVSVFCSSSPGDIRLGFRWSAEIQRNLQEAGALILIATSRSIERHWVWFESGVFWFDRPIIICCFGELRPDTLPPPLGERQAITLATAKDLKVLLQQLAGIVGLAITDDGALEALANRLAELEQQAHTQSDAEQEWIGVAWEGKFLVCDGPIERLNLIEPEYYQESMNTALTGSGFSLKLIRRDQVGEFKDRRIKPVSSQTRNTGARRYKRAT
jgi:hypothetical protein